MRYVKCFFCAAKIQRDQRFRLTRIKGPRATIVANICEACGERLVEALPAVAKALRS